MTITLDEAAGERLAWLLKSLAMAGVKTTPSEIASVLIMLNETHAPEDAAPARPATKRHDR